MASWQPPDIVLVGCVKTKRRVRSAAKDLYTSLLWRYRRAYAECLGVPWYILSALHGLLDPDRRIDAYELALTDLRAKARRVWSARVLADLKRRVPSMQDKRIEIHAGATYTSTTGWKKDCVMRGPQFIGHSLALRGSRASRLGIGRGWTSTDRWINPTHAFAPIPAESRS